MAVWPKNLRCAFRIVVLGVFLKKRHVRFQGCAVPKLDFSHIRGGEVVLVVVVVGGGWCRAFCCRGYGC